jgi:hypothetical protein
MIGTGARRPSVSSRERDAALFPNNTKSNIPFPSNTFLFFPFHKNYVFVIFFQRKKKGTEGWKGRKEESPVGLKNKKKYLMTGLRFQ